jgi:hypothetical protein
VRWEPSGRRSCGVRGGLRGGVRGAGSDEQMIGRLKLVIGRPTRTGQRSHQILSNFIPFIVVEIIPLIHFH